ncbi:MAG TPA: IS3 family transposase [Acidimicrobiales bacterium]|nr:IS3 family transposase [Acidimicrobiales bacterium]
MTVGNEELAAMRREVRQLREEAEITRRLASFEDAGRPRERIYRFIATESATFALTTLCRVCRVSRSAYYAWLNKGQGPSAGLVEEAELANRIYDIWRKSRRRYGSPRVTAALWKAGEQVSEKRVAKLMAEIGIAGICGRKKMVTTRRDPTHTPAADLVERDFSAEEPDELWLTDITYVPTDEGWLYVCSILDVFSRMLLGWSIADHLRTELCLDALHGAAGFRGRSSFVGTVLHSDRGCQYTSDEFKRHCRLLGIVQSMGTVGDSYDNAMMESAWSSLKRELVYESHFTTKNEARKAVFEWMVWYNNERLHSSIDYMSPMEFEEFWSNQDAA